MKKNLLLTFLLVSGLCIGQSMNAFDLGKLADEVTKAVSTAGDILHDTAGVIAAAKATESGVKSSTQQIKEADTAKKIEAVAMLVQSLMNLLSELEKRGGLLDDTATMVGIFNAKAKDKFNEITSSLRSILQMLGAIPETIKGIASIVEVAGTEGG